MKLEKSDLDLAIEGDDRTPDHVIVWYTADKENPVEYDMSEIWQIRWDEDIARCSLRFAESDVVWDEKAQKMVNYCGVRVFPKDYWK